MTSANKPHEIQNLSELNRIIDHENTFVLMYYGSYFKNVEKEITSFAFYKKILEMMSIYDDFVFINVDLNINTEINSIYMIKAPAEFLIFERGAQSLREQASNHALLDVESCFLWSTNPNLLRRKI